MAGFAFPRPMVRVTYSVTLVVEPGQEVALIERLSAGEEAATARIVGEFMIPCGEVRIADIPANTPLDDVP
jgi:ABC-type transport system involved in cytochrome bd biosynthesis fused ATPase/permease subunit